VTEKLYQPGTPLDVLGLKPHTREVLEANWYRTIEQVRCLSSYHLRCYCPGIGPVRTREIFRAVERYNALARRRTLGFLRIEMT
jgi:hypothetical protein